MIDIVGALKNKYVGAALIGVSAAVLVPKNVRPKVVRDDVAMAAFTGAAWASLWYIVERNKPKPVVTVTELNVEKS